MLRNVNDVVTELKEACKRQVKYLQERLDETIVRIEQNRQVVPELQDMLYRLGQPEAMHLSEWSNGDSIRVNLGVKPDTAKGKKQFHNLLLSLRQVLGRLSLFSKDVADSKKRLVEMTLEAKDYPGIRIVYLQKLPREAKCRIVKHKQKAYTSYSLVCEA